MFIVGSALGIRYFIINVFIIEIEQDRDEEALQASKEYFRLLIAQTCLDICSTLNWFIIHCLMLNIFIKYGKPLEDDEKVLFRNKLIEVFEELKSEEGKVIRRQKAYEEMADLQVKEILRTMRTCSSTREEQNISQSYNEGVSRSARKFNSRPTESSGH